MYVYTFKCSFYTVYIYLPEWKENDFLKKPVNLKK